MDEKTVLYIALATTIILIVLTFALFWLALFSPFHRLYHTQHLRDRKLRRLARELNRLHNTFHFLDHRVRDELIVHVIIDIDSGRYELEQDPEVSTSLSGSTLVEMNSDPTTGIARSFSGDTLVAQNESV